MFYCVILTISWCGNPGQLLLGNLQLHLDGPLAQAGPRLHILKHFCQNMYFKENAGNMFIECQKISYLSL